MKKLATVKELVSITGDVFDGESISENAIRKHILRLGLKGQGRGLYPVDEVLAQIKKGRADHYSPTKDNPASEMRNKKLKLECDLLQAKIDEVRRVTMPVDECRDLLVAHMNMVRISIQNFPKDVSSILQSPEAMKALEDKCASVLNQLSEECAKYDRAG